MQFAARAARSLVSGGTPPVILVAEPIDHVPGNAHLSPEVEGLVVRIMDCYREALSGQTELRRDELQGELHRLLLEVIADAEVAKHLEHREVGRVSNFVDIDGAKRLLSRGETTVGRSSLS